MVTMLDSYCSVTYFHISLKVALRFTYSGALRTGSSNAYVLRTYAEVNGKNEIIYGGVANG